MTCCPAEKELLLSWKGIIVLISCAKVKHRNTLQLDISSTFLYLLPVILHHQFRIRSYSDTCPSVAVIICFAIIVLFHEVMVAGV